VTLAHMELITAFGAGLIAGLALAVPLGAIGVLLIHEGASRGWRRGAPAAAGVATVDMLDCIAAVAGGSALAPVIAAWDPWPRVVGGATLIALATWNLARMRRSPAVAGAAAEVSPARSRHRYALFVGLTAINPATLIYFAAIVTGLPAVSDSPFAACLFTAGVTLASLSWQLLLVLAGAVLRRRTGSRFRRLTTLIGNGAVGVLGVLMIADTVL